MFNLYFSEEDSDRCIVVEFKDGLPPVKIYPCHNSYEIVGHLESVKKAQAIAKHFTQWLNGGQFPWDNQEKF